MLDWLLGKLFDRTPRDMTYFYIVSGNPTLVRTYLKILAVGAAAYGGMIHDHAQAFAEDLETRGDLPFTGQSFMAREGRPISRIADIVQNHRVELSTLPARSIWIAGGYVCAEEGIAWVHKVYEELLGQAVSQGILPPLLYVTKDHDSSRYLYKSLRHVAG